MSIICSICGKKQSGFFDDYPLSAEHREMRICVSCQSMLQTIEEAQSDEEANEAVKYFNGFLAQGAGPEVVKRVSASVNKRLGIVNEAEQEPAPTTVETFTYETEKEGFKFSLNDLYNDIGKKIKSWAKWIFVIEAISALIGAIGLMLSGEEDLLLLGILLLIMGPAVAFVSTWILYGFGELVDKACTKEQQDAQYYAFMSENLKAMRENSDKMLELLQKLNYK